MTIAQYFKIAGKACEAMLRGATQDAFASECREVDYAWESLSKGDKAIVLWICTVTEKRHRIEKTIEVVHVPVHPISASYHPLATKIGKLKKKKVAKKRR